MLMKQLNEKLFKNTKLIKILKQKANVLDMILKQFPHVSNETASDYVTLQKTAKSPIEIETIPQTSQETIEGYNKFNPNWFEFRTNNGITATLEDDHILLNGTATGNAYFNFTIPSNTFAGSFTWLVKSDVDLAGMNILRSSGGNVNIVPTAAWSKSQFSSDTVTGGYIYVATGSALTNCKVYIDVREGFVDLETFVYQPFTGGIAAPNPDFPMDIHCTTGDNQIKVVGKNISKMTIFGRVPSISNGQFVNYGSASCTDFIRIDNSLDYTFSYNLSDRTSIYVLFYDEQKSYLGYIRDMTSGWNLSSYNRYSESSYVIVRCDNNSILDWIQLETGSTATSFTPYEEKTYPISLGNKELYNIYGVYDGFVYDETTDKFYFRRWNRKIELPIADMNNFSENYPGWRNIEQIRNDYPDQNTYLGLFTKYFTNIGILKGTGFSNNPVGITTKTNGILILNKDYFNLTQTEWKNQYLNLVFKLVYVLQEYEDEEITDSTLISQLRVIKNALSMQETTHIISTATGENLPFLIKSSAVKSFE